MQWAWDATCRKTIWAETAWRPLGSWVFLHRASAPASSHCPAMPPTAPVCSAAEASSWSLFPVSEPCCRHTGTPRKPAPGTGHRQKGKSHWVSAQKASVGTWTNHEHGQCLGTQCLCHLQGLAFLLDYYVKQYLTVIWFSTWARPWEGQAWLLKADRSQNQQQALSCFHTASKFSPPHHIRS